MINPARPSLLVSDLFDAGVASAELREPPDAGLLYPAEAALCARFAPKRLADFTAGRLCARRVLDDLGVRDFPLEIERDRSPRWPPGVVGSITHTQGFCCAVAARSGATRGVGVDAELVGRLTPELEPIVFTERERRFVDTLTEAARQQAATIIFSAKEAFYKCQYPLTRRWLDFTDVQLELSTRDMQRGTFAVRAANEAVNANGPTALLGRFCVSGNLVVTGIACDQDTLAELQAIRARDANVSR